MALIELDYLAEEIGIMAGLSGDAAMLADYLTGDPYLEFGKRSGLIPPDGTKKSHPIERAICKIVCLGMNYGMTPYGIAAKTERSLAWAREIHARHRRAYPVFHQWLGDLIAQSRFDGIINSPFGWPQLITEHTKTRSLMNFPAQAGGGDILRLAAIAATECGLSIAAPVHDAFWILAPLADLDETVARMSDIMRRAGELVAGIPIGVEVAAVVRWPQSLGDVREPGDRAQAMWSEIRGLVQMFTQEREGQREQETSLPAG
jgi:DNA polymerase I-like protein with 3'-5' exonuclease and polymerase domains